MTSVMWLVGLFANTLEIRRKSMKLTVKKIQKMDINIKD